jgi:hypothetical protein
MENFRKQYRDLEMRVLNELRNKIEKSKRKSKHTGQKAIKVNVFDYTELTIREDNLVFLDEYGYEYSVFNEVSLEDLINILQK